jgi:hypothetical protein
MQVTEAGHDFDPGDPSDELAALTTPRTEECRECFEPFQAAVVLVTDRQVIFQDICGRCRDERAGV